MLNEVGESPAPQKAGSLLLVQRSAFIFGGDWTRTSGDRSRGIYSPLQLPLCDTPIEMGLLAKGLEPSTVRLQVGRSTN